MKSLDAVSYESHGKQVTILSLVISWLVVVLVNLIGMTWPYYYNKTGPLSLVHFRIICRVKLSLSGNLVKQSERRSMLFLIFTRSFRLIIYLLWIFVLSWVFMFLALIGPVYVLSLIGPVYVFCLIGSVYAWV